MSETLAAPAVPEVRYPGVPPFAAQRHPAVDRFYLLSEQHFNVGATVVDGEAVGFGRQTPAAVQWGMPDKGPLDFMRFTRGYGGKLELDSTATIWSPPEADDPRRRHEGLTEDWRVVWTPNGLVVGASEVQHYFDLATGETKYTPSAARWQARSLDDLLGRRVVKTVFGYAEADHSGQMVPIDGKNFTPNKFARDPGGKSSEIKFFHRLETESHAWLLLSQTPKGLRIDQKIAIPKVDWNEDKSGTCGSLIWLDQHNAICITHGFTRRVEGVGYYYSIGWGWFKVDPVTGHCSMPYLDPHPLVTPHMFGEGDELHSERRVSYSCGNLETRDPKYKRLEGVEILVNRGDRQTLAVEVDPTPMEHYIRQALRVERNSLAIGNLSLGLGRRTLGSAT